MRRRFRQEIIARKEEKQKLKSHIIPLYLLFNYILHKNIKLHCILVYNQNVFLREG